MNTKIIPEIKKIEVKSAPLNLLRFALSDDIKESLEVAQDIWSELWRGLLSENAQPIHCETDKVIHHTFEQHARIESITDEWYKISAVAGEIHIITATTRGLMYALYTLIELHNLNDGNLTEFELFDTPDLEFRAVSDDLSRGQISNTMNFLRTITKLARYKYNTYMPYIEDVFKFDNINAWGRYSDPVSKMEWELIVKYARQYKIEVRPIINLLGHFDKGCFIKELQPLAIKHEDRITSVLDPKNPTVREYICTMLDEIIEVFGVGVIHCGGDEPVELTKAYGVEEGGQLFIDHYTFIHDELKKRNCSLMMYADFFAPPWGDYAVPVDRAKELPPETEFVFWDYAPRDAYPFVDALHDQNIKMYMSPGSWTWNRCCCDIKTCYENTKGLLKADKGRSLGMIMSNWADGGDSLRELAWPGVVVGANFCWATESSFTYEEVYNTYHKSFFDINPEEAALLDPIYHHDALANRKDQHEWKAFMFSSPFTLIDYQDIENIDKVIDGLAKAHKDYLSIKAHRNFYTFDVLEYSVVSAKFVANKIKYMPHATRDGKLMNIEDSIKYSSVALDLAKELTGVKSIHQKLWNNTNRTSEWDSCSAMYDDQCDLLNIFARNVKLRRFHQNNWWNK